MFNKTNDRFETSSLEEFASVVHFLGLYHCTGPNDLFMLGTPNVCETCYEEAVKNYSNTKEY